MTKTGIFGGAFNPVHNAHIQMAEHALASGLDEIVFLPSNNPPHKNCNTTFENRAKMLENSLGNYPEFSVSRLEGSSDKVHYTCEVIPMLKECYGDIVYIIGGDSLIDLHKWKNPEKIISEVPLIAFPRKGRENEFYKAYEFWKAKGADIHICEFVPDELSSTNLRYHLELGDYQNIPIQAKDYIIEHGLYKNYDNIVATLKGQVLEHTFEHIKRTVFYALNLNEKARLCLDSEKVFLASLLHDCAKYRCKLPHDTSCVPQDCIGGEVEHQFFGKMLANSLYGINDDEILQAIGCHCTGKENMSLLDKLVFCADMLEENRSYQGVDELRALIEKNFEKGFVACLNRSYQYLLEKNCDIYPLTKKAVDFYNKK